MLESHPIDQEPTSSETLEARALKSPTFCIFPFSHLATKTDGTFKLCCRSLPVSHIRDESALEVWNGEKYKSIRQMMMAGERPFECEDCWELEDVGTRSMRQRALNQDHAESRWNTHKHLLKNYNQDGSMKNLPVSLELKLSNYCNLRCRMCHPVDSTSWSKDWTVVEDLMKPFNDWTYNAVRENNLVAKPHVSGFQDNAQWWREFEQIVDHVDLIEFAGGEPLLDPLHYQILKMLERRAPEIRLKYSTNLTRLGLGQHNVLELWKNFKSVSVYTSMDGIYGVYDYIRTGAKFEGVLQNLQTILTQKEVKFDELAVACTIQVYNAFQLPEIFEYFSNMNIVLHTHRVTSPNFLSVKILPQDVKKQLTEEANAFLQKLSKRTDIDEYKIRHMTRHMKDHLNFMNGTDDNERCWGPFLDYTRRMDKARNTSVVESIPQLKRFFEAT